MYITPVFRTPPLPLSWRHPKLTLSSGVNPKRLSVVQRASGGGRRPDTPPSCQSCSPTCTLHIGAWAGELCNLSLYTANSASCKFDSFCWVVNWSLEQQDGVRQSQLWQGLPLLSEESIRA